MSLKASQLSKSVFAVQTDQLGNQSALLQDIKENTTSISVSANNPSGVKTPLKCTNDGHLEISATFSGDSMVVKGNDAQANPQTLLTDTGGRLNALMVGHDGNQNNIVHIDSNGILKSQVVNAPSIIPHATVNSAQTDAPSNSFTVGLQGRTTIGTASTSTNLLCDSAGRLQVSVPQTTGIKLEDVSSTLDADHANNSRSIPMTMKGRTNISDHNTGTYCLVDSAGHLQVDVVSGGGGGDATAANQTTGNSSLSSIDGKLPTALSNGNLKVSIQEGNISGFATSTLQGGGLPAALDSGALKVKEQSPISGFSTESTLSALNTKKLSEAGLFSSRFTSEALSAHSSSSNLTVDLGANHNYRMLKFFFSLSQVNQGIALYLYLQISTDGTNWIYVGNNFSTVSVTDSNTGNSLSVGNAKLEDPPRYVRVYNNYTTTSTIDEIYYVACRN